MKLNLSKTQFYIGLSVAILTVAGLDLFENNVDMVFAQTDTATTTSTNNTNTTLAIDQQQPNFYPQMVLIIEEQGKITNQRVIDVDPHPIIESTFVANQTILGNIPARDLGTYTATLLPDGTIHGEGQGISTTTDGERVTWTAEGDGNTNAQGVTIFQGSLFLHTSVEGELSYLNNKVAFFDYVVDSEGNTSADVWEIR